MRSRDLTAERAAELLRGIRPRDTAGKTLRGLAADLIAEIRHLDRRIAKAAADIQTAVTASGTTLTELCGIGDADRGQDPRPGRHHHSIPLRRRVRHLHRHRPDRRVLRRCCPPPALPRRRPPTQPLPPRHGLTQIRQDTPGRAYYLRKRTEGKSHKEAMRCLKRRLSDVVYRQLRRDANTTEAGPGGHSGAALSSSAAS